jgi:hypothetical protein
MLGMLVVVFCFDNVAIRRRLSRERKVALIVPVRTAAPPAVLPLAVGGIRAAGRRPSSLRPWTASRSVHSVGLP